MFIGAVVLTGAGGWAFIHRQGEGRAVAIGLVGLGVLLLVAALISAANYTA
jgi:hypothetical protein